ncbi:UV DNA damage repair endonuclease UvsE [Bacillus sp. FJAT-45037]|uniref:UV DNA damage repair endonuclease UvsE n=1 Tax=Bacillus sp. FJAT-45037 TaxID=2011007 RepID=UPI000C24592E|nr:UV DNA damage repair endonuclease UvsE [Bacillus sp. FJAT-45037]
MRIRFGYVAMSQQLVNASPSKTMTVKQFTELDHPEAAIRKLERIAKENIKNCLRLVKHNKASDVTFFRLSSRLVPLANHPLTEGWKYERAIAAELGELGQFINENKMRVDFHPDHFVVLNSKSKQVTQQALQQLLYHYKLLKGLHIDPVHRCVLHIGGKKEGTEGGLERFIENFSDIPSALSNMLILENDDKNYTIEDALYLGEKLGIPIVFDLHHYDVHQNDSYLPELWNRVVATWKESPLPVKMHISSPKDGPGDRAHAEYIDTERFVEFLKMIDGSVDQLDVMIEAKQKDLALERLLNELSTYSSVHHVSGSEIDFYQNEIANHL